MNPYCPVVRTFLAAAKIKPEEARQPEKDKDKERHAPLRDHPDMNQFQLPEKTRGQRALEYYWEGFEQ